MVRLNKNGGPKNPEKIDRLCALFTVKKKKSRVHLKMRLKWVHLFLKNG